MLILLTQIQPVESHFQILDIHNMCLLANLQITVGFALSALICIQLRIASLFLLLFFLQFFHENIMVCVCLYLLCYSSDRYYVLIYLVTQLSCVIDYYTISKRGYLSSILWYMQYSNRDSYMYESSGETKDFGIQKNDNKC